MLENGAKLRRKMTREIRFEIDGSDHFAPNSATECCVGEGDCLECGAPLHIQYGHDARILFCDQCNLIAAVDETNDFQARHPEICRRSND